MSRGATVFLLAAAILLSALVGGSVLMRTLGAAAKPVGSALFAFDPDDIRSVKIQNGDASFELKKTDNGWQISPLPRDRASSEAIKELVQTALSTLVLDRILSREIADKDRLSEFGVRKSQLQLDFRGDKDLSLIFGKDTVDETRGYVRFENSEDVYVISNKLSRMIQRPVGDFRDRRLASVHPARVDRMVIKRPGGEMELRRDGQGWKIVKPLSARADAAFVSSFLEKLLRSGVEGFVAEEGGDPGTYGLSEPAAEVQLFGEGDKDPQIIRLGSAAREGGVYARLIPRNVICRLPDSVSKQLALDLASFRDLALARINLDMVDLIRITAGSSRVVLKRAPDGWELDDGSKRTAVAADAVPRMVQALAQAKTVRFEPATIGALQKAGLESPALSVSFLSVVSENTPESPAGEQAVIRLDFGTVRQNGLVGVHAEGSPEIFFVSEKVLEAIPANPAGWNPS